MKMRWNSEEVDHRLHEIMTNIHEQCVKNGKKNDGSVDYVKGANIAGFLKVANSMLDMGVI
jgi:glutamate dehydrogenase (NADP+)